MTCVWIIRPGRAILKASLRILFVGVVFKVSNEYPRYALFPHTKLAPGWVIDVASCFEKHRSQIDTRTAPHKTSDEVLEILRPELEQIGFKVEAGKRQSEKLHRPVLFGESGVPRVKYEIDAYQNSNGVVLEVEAGRSIMGNAIFRDIIQMSLMVDATNAVIAMPQVYRYMSSGKSMTNHAYDDGLGILDAIWSSRRLQLPFEGLLLIGY